MLALDAIDRPQFDVLVRQVTERTRVISGEPREPVDANDAVERLVVARAEVDAIRHRAGPTAEESRKEAARG